MLLLGQLGLMLKLIAAGASAEAEGGSWRLCGGLGSC